MAVGSADDVKRKFEGTVYGEACSKANSRRFVRRGSRMVSIKSDKALAFEATSIVQLQALWKGQEPLIGDLVIHAAIYYPSQRNDLDGSIFFDTLQKAGVVLNDRQLKEMHLYRETDKVNPRVEFLIEQR